MKRNTKAQWMNLQQNNKSGAISFIVWKIWSHTPSASEVRSYGRQSSMRRVITLQIDSCHNLDPLQMICINFQIHNLQYIDVSLCNESFKKISGLSFSKLSFKV